MIPKELANDIFNQAADAQTLIDSLMSHVEHIEAETETAEAWNAKRLTVMINEKLSSIIGLADRLQQENV